MLQIFEREKIFHLCTEKISYLIQVEGDSVRNLYYGSVVDGRDAVLLLSRNAHSSFETEIRAEREEYPLWNGHDFHLPCLQAHNDAGRAIFGTYRGYEKAEGEESDRLDLLMEDTAMGLQIRLRYLLYHDSGILARSTVLTAMQQVELDRVMSAAVSLPAGQPCQARYVTGKWAGEFRIQDSPIQAGILTLQSKRGITGHQFNPAIALAEPGTDEKNGRVWFGLLAYSGNWSIQVEQSIFGNTHITAGIHDHDFEMTLAAGTTFETPVFYTGYTERGYGGMSRLAHRFIRKRILPQQKARPVLYNSWEATAFEVKAEAQKKLADRAAAIGCELFVVDDGWFGERHSDQAGLGDWWVNKEKFPHGLEELVEYVKHLGMRFGIWVEPEAVNPDSDLYRAHPDWIYRYPNQEPIRLRNQYLLNLSLPSVQEYLKKMLYDLLSRHEISFIKWDMNRVITDPQSALDQAGKTLWYDHVHALYDLWQFVRESFPQLEMETCSGGGARIDLGIFRYAEQCWPSDNTDPYTRLFIQEGYTQFYPPLAMMCWVTDSPTGTEWFKRSLAYRFHSAMCGGLGIGSNIAELSDAELTEYAAWISLYKKWRHIVGAGELYRLSSPRDSYFTALEYVTEAQEEALLFLFVNGLPTDQEIPPIRLQGLDRRARYYLESWEEVPAKSGSLPEAQEAVVVSGATLVNAGLPVELAGDFGSRVVYLRRDS